MRYASNAVLAKARAMYAGHVTPSEYETLISCHTVNELLSQLQRRKRYASSLSRATAQVTPMQAEELLRLSVYEQLATLSRYEISERNEFYRFYIAKREIAQILRYIRLLTSGRAGEYLAELPPFFSHLTEVDLIRLAGAKSFADVLGVLEGTPYQRILKPFEPVFGEKGVYLRIEAAFHEYLYQYLFSCAKHDKANEKQMKEALSLYLDSAYVTAMYRMKKMRVGDEEVYRCYLFDKYTAFTKQQISLLNGAKDEKDFMRALRDTTYGEALKSLDYGESEQVMENYICEKFRKGLRFYTDPAAVMLCYMYLCENETRNIIRVIEGIRYGVSPDKIRGVLTGIRS